MPVWAAIPRCSPACTPACRYSRLATRATSVWGRPELVPCMHLFDVLHGLRAKCILVLGGPRLKAENHHVVRGGRFFPSRKPAVCLGQMVLDLIVLGR